MDIRSNEPFWLIKNGLITTYPSLRESEETEILIVGSGITGALMAHACMNAGWKTMLVDRRDIAHGSTSATTSMLQYEIDVPLHELIEDIGEEGAIGAYHGCRDAIDTIARLTKKIRHKCGFKRKKSLYFCNDEDGESMLRKEFDARKKAGFLVRWLDEKQLYRRYGLKARCGILSRDGASIDAFEFVHRLLAYNHKKGLQIFDRAELKSHTSDDNGVLATFADGQEIRAKHIIFCTGYEAQSMLKEKIVNLLSTYACTSEADLDLPRRMHDTLFWNTESPYLYFRTTDDHRLLIGGEDEKFTNAARRDRQLDAKEEKLASHIDRLFPDVDFVSDFRWAGTFGKTEDGLPYIGAHPESKNTWFVLGFGGNGILFSVMGMDVITQGIKGKKHPMTEYFRFGR